MGFLEEFQARVQKLNEQRCEDELEEIRQGIEAGSITPGRSHLRFSDEALDEQKHCIRIADEKIALASLVYDLVDEQICQLDQHMKKLEVIRQEKETAASGPSTANADGNTRTGKASESNRGGRKKSKIVAQAEQQQQPKIDFELPVDPNEPTYCICNQVSWGEMVACDNPDCKIEWFHFPCVGLKEQPKGKWYCPGCASLPKRRKGK